MRYGLRTLLMLPLLTAANYFLASQWLKNRLATQRSPDFLDQQISLILLTFTLAGAALYILNRVSRYVDKMHGLAFVGLACAMNSVVVLYLLCVVDYRFLIAATLFTSFTLVALSRIEMHYYTKETQDSD